MENEKEIYKNFQMKLANEILAYFFTCYFQCIPITHSKLQEKFNKNPDRIAQLLKPFKGNNLIDIFQIKNDDSEYTREGYMLNKKGMEVAHNIIRKWLPNESILLIEYINKIHRLLILALNFAYLI